MTNKPPITYPIIKVPQEIFSIANSIPRPEGKPPIEPRMPIEQEVPLPKEPSKPDGDYSVQTKIVLFFGGVGAWLAYLGSESRYNSAVSFWGYVFLIIAVLITILSIRASSSDADAYATSLNAYQQEKKAHPGKAKAAKEAFKKAMLYYTQQQQQYVIDKEAYNDAARVLSAPKAVNQYRKDALQKFLKGVSAPVSKPEEVKVTLGAAEECFAVALSKILVPQYVFLNAQLKFLDSEQGYYPDIVIYDYETGLLIDVEIDEPYIGNTGNPIHYIGCNDEKRDNFFKERGWLVIRFYEEQVVCQTEQCINSIRNVIEALQSEGLADFSETQKIAQQKFLSNIVPYPKWEKNDVFEMVFKKTRANYLSNEEKQHTLFRIDPKELSARIPKLTLTPEKPLNDIKNKNHNIKMRTVTPEDLAAAQLFADLI